MYEIIFTPQSKKQFLKLEKKTQERIINGLDRIKFRPEKFVKKLVEKNVYRLRIGDYRVILDIIGNKLLILVLKVGHRKKIYGKI
ncbi:type II toxin-antitoxin system RelE/ParE family toxin [archaeon]|nr:type II toxin-antitoxin system RelE/ParE family toxin [archaeon]